MKGKNACEGILGNPQLLGSINRLVSSVYRQHLPLMQDSSFDVEDLSQELMLELCDEQPRSCDEHYQRLATDRLKDICARLTRSLADGEGGRVEIVPFTEAAV